jgi:hypothetical protein
MIKAEEQFREPTPPERALLDRLLEADFPGKEGLHSLLRKVLVRAIDEDGSLEIKSLNEGRALVIKEIPVEAEAQSDDGIRMHALLHVVEGRPVELELYREDGARINRIPPASAFELIVLPPAPDLGWAGDS